MFLKNTLQFSKTQSYVRLFTTEPKVWLPKKRVSRMTMDKIRALNASQPDIFNAVKLSEEFKLSVEAIRRILKSKYEPKPDSAERQEKNRYEAMGERRKQFQNEYYANRDYQLKRSEKNLDETSNGRISERREVKDTWKNENITRAGWKSDSPFEKLEVKDTRRSRDNSNDRRGWSERGRNLNESQYNNNNTRKPSFSRDRDGNDDRWRNNSYNQKDRSFDERRRDTYNPRDRDGNDNRWRNDKFNQKERPRDRSFDDRRKNTHNPRDRDDNDNRWRNNDSYNQKERPRDRSFDDRRRDMHHSRDHDDNNRRWKNDSNDQGEKQWTERRRNNRMDDASDDKRRNGPFRVNDRRKENGWRNGRDRED